MRGTSIRHRLRREANRATRLSVRARLDLADALRGRRDPRVPPRWMGLPSQMRGVGDLFVERILVGQAALEPTDRVLDIGCAVGRMAIPLTDRLGSGSYEGFDVDRRSIRWAQRKITPRHPSFRFQVIDAENALYNPGGEADAAALRFPYEEDEFDLAFANSLFTHLPPNQTIHYLAEAARVLRPGGRLVSSFFLIDDEVEQLIAGGLPPGPGNPTGLRLDHELSDQDGNRYRTPHPSLPEHRIACYRSDVIDWHRMAGLKVDRVIDGTWCGRAQTAGNAAHDYLVAVRA